MPTNQLCALHWSLHPTGTWALRKGLFEVGDLAGYDLVEVAFGGGDVEDVGLGPVAVVVIIICIEEGLAEGGEVVGAFLGEVAVGVPAVFFGAAVDAVLTLIEGDVGAVAEVVVGIDGGSQFLIVDAIAGDLLELAFFGVEVDGAFLEGVGDAEHLGGDGTVFLVVLVVSFGEELAVRFLGADILDEAVALVVGIVDDDDRVAEGVVVGVLGVVALFVVVVAAGLPHYPTLRGADGGKDRLDGAFEVVFGDVF